MTTAPVATPNETFNGLWAVISDPNLSYHFSESGVNKDAGTVFDRFTIELDISGDDYRGTVNSTGGSGRAQLVRKDTVVYGRLPGHQWVSRPMLYDALFQFTPFLGIRTKAALEPDGVEAHDGKQLSRFVSTNQYLPIVAHMQDLSQFFGVCNQMQLTLLTTDAGVPVSAHFECDATNDHYLGVSDFEFSQFGKSFDIQAPVR